MIPDTFDRCRTQADVERAIQALAAEALPESGGSLRSLLERPATDLRPGEATREALAAIGRLLARSATPRSLASLLTLSHRLHDLEHASACRDARAPFLRGVARIGLGETAQGARSVLSFADREACPSGDGVLCHWALVGAAIARRDLRLAVQFARKWRDTADSAGLGGETIRAGLALEVLRLVLGEGRGEIPPGVPQEWREIARAVEAWNEEPATEAADPNSLPLFLGTDWSPAGGTPAELAAPDFASLCRLRRGYRDSRARAGLATEELERLAQVASRWGLARPLEEIESDLRDRSLETFYRARLTRLLGEQVFDRIVRVSPQDPLAVERQDVVIWVADVRSFAELCENTSPSRVFDLLAPVFRILDEEIEGAGGLIVEFVGDSIVSVFQAFPGQVLDETAILDRTVRALDRLHVDLALRRRVGERPMRIGVGIQRGSVAVGNLGGLRRCHLTILGHAVNQAARIEGLTRELPGPIAVERSFFGEAGPAVWRDPARVHASIRDMGRRPLRNIAAPAHLYSLAPLLRYWIDFVPMGYADAPPPGVVYIDTGGSSPGVVDHHHEGSRAASSCELLVGRPEILLDHVKGVLPADIEFRLHEKPDLDCAATLYAAYEFLEGQPRRGSLETLARYVSRIDQGRLPGACALADSLYGIFLAHTAIVARERGGRPSDREILEAELRVIDAAMFLFDRGATDPTCVFASEPAWFAGERDHLRADRQKYVADRARGLTYEARVRGHGGPVTGLWLDRPESLLFKLWARNDPDAPGERGFPFLAVDWSEPGKNRFVLSVDPESGTDLAGLGEALEAAEAARCRELGLERPVEPRRWPADNADPWYFGQGHRYTIVDAPARGTVLTADEVRAIHEAWTPSPRRT